VNATTEAGKAGNANETMKTECTFPKGTMPDWVVEAFRVSYQYCLKRLKEIEKPASNVPPPAKAAIPPGEPEGVPHNKPRRSGAGGDGKADESFNRGDCIHYKRITCAVGHDTCIPVCSDYEPKSEESD
jgi:hypothetical protein